MDSTSTSAQSNLDVKSPEFSHMIFGGSQYQEQSPNTFDTNIDMSVLDKDFGSRKSRRLLTNGNDRASSPATVEMPRRALVSDMEAYEDRRNPGQVLVDIEANPVALEGTTNGAEQPRLSDIDMDAPDNGSSGSSSGESPGTTTWFEFYNPEVVYRRYGTGPSTGTMNSQPKRRPQRKSELEENTGENLMLCLATLAFFIIFGYWFYKEVFDRD